jgi:hypothetical protein
MGPILASVESPKTLEEFVVLTTPPLTEEGFKSVIAFLEPQRNYVESHLRNFSAVHENWRGFVQNLWKSLPETVLTKVAETIVQHKK